MKIDQSVIGSRSGRWIATGPKFTKCNRVKHKNFGAEVTQ